ncbi:MAG: DUF2339 domain-containing protein [Cyclobacteriaceae bacterium]|nr:DUF2339 domain-containing protein [Cyclobacteriaceae bacterium]
MDKNAEIDKLYQRVEDLLRQQDSFLKEINALRDEMARLKSSTAEQVLMDKINQISEEVPDTVSEQKLEPKPVLPPLPASKTLASEPASVSKPVPPSPVHQKPAPNPVFDEIRQNMERFIGESLISKIGILIIVIGVSIGAKYAIENQLINPLTRIIIGYLIGAALLFFAIKLKVKYKKFSAVLLSGAMAILYFITYAAYDFYDLMPQTAAFAIMVLFTAFTVFAALQYDMILIALLGLIGAYSVPFALSDGSGRIGVLFTYMSVINTGILFIAFRKAWKSLFYVAFGVSWLVFLGWFGEGYNANEHLTLGLVFLTVFFMIFYATLFSYKLVAKEKFSVVDVLLLLLNAFIAYGVGYRMIESNPNGDELLGLYTLIHAIIHFVAALIIYKNKLADKEFLYFTTAMVLTFITIAVPVQLNGDWVTLVWVAESVILYYLGNTGKIPIYKTIGYVMVGLALISLIEDWGNYYNAFSNTEDPAAPFMNIHFFTSLFAAGAFGYINILFFKNQASLSDTDSAKLQPLLSAILPGVFVFVTYMACFLEIGKYFDLLYSSSNLYINNADGYEDFYSNYDIFEFKNLALIGYSMLFFSVLMVLNRKYFNKEKLSITSYSLGGITVLVFLFAGLLSLSLLRYNYINQVNAEFYSIGFFNVSVRYILFLLVGFLFWNMHKTTSIIKSIELLPKIHLVFLQLSFVWILSSELFNILELNGFHDTYRLALSLLWGFYSMTLIVFGIWKKVKIWRMIAIGLFAVTLVKLFLYDIADMNTLSKTLVFVILGVFLLIISFLYTKYKRFIFDEDN